MASTIQLKTGTGSAVPSSLTQGEVAINIDNGLVYYGSGSGNTRKQLETFTHITASGNISASGNLYGTIVSTQRIQHTDDSSDVYFATGINVAGGNHITASGNINSNGTINGIRLSQAGNLINDTFAPIAGHANIVTVGALNAGSITSGFTSIDVGSGAIKTTGILLGGNITGSNISASGTISGSKGHFVDGLTLGTRLNANQIGANGNVGNTEYGYLNGVTSAIQTQFDAKAPTANPSFTGTASFASHITSSGNISASGTIQAPSFVGTPVILEQFSIYATSIDGSTPEYRAGASTGVESGNWSQNISSRTAPTANEALYGMLLPFKMRNVSLKATARSQGGGAPALWMYTGSRSNGTSAYDLGFAASASCGVVGSSTGAYNIDITGSAAFNTRAEDDTLFLYLGNDTAATDTMRVTVIIYGEKDE